ncbi:MAG: hypothetical protein M9928_21160 [Anaerolineae bacterium]|nr:hypothetical protein [Anaerolineae bacterium]
MSTSLRTRFNTVRRSDAFDSVLMTGAMVLAGGFDYLTNLVAGSMLGPVAFGAFVAVAAIVQIMVHVTNVIRNVTAYYSAEINTRADANPVIGRFFKRGWRWAWQWGVIATAIMALLSPLIAPLLQLPSTSPLWAASVTLLLLFLRPVTDGVLQGIQHFVGLASVQVTQAIGRMVFAVVFILIGWQAFGALLALPVASALACVLALWFLRPQRRAGRDSAEAITLPHISRSYTMLTLVGLLSFAVLVNMDAILVKSFFDPETAGNYGVVVTLGKMNLFIPLALGMVLFPKAVDRQAKGRDPRPLLLLALGATLAAGLALTAVYFLLPSLIVDTVFRGAYANPGLVLGIVGIATTLYAATNIWLNYALSLRRTLFVAALAIIVVAQASAIVLFHDELQQVALILVAGGVAANLVGITTLVRRTPTFPLDAPSLTD